VTGASSGIGRAACELFLARGLAVVGLDREEPAAPAGTDRWASVVGDVTDPAANAIAADLAAERFGGIDVAVLNAGMPIPGGLDDADLALVERGFAVNVHGVVLGLRATLPGLRRSDSAAVVVTGSITGSGGDPVRWAYAAAKAAVMNIVRSAACALAPENVRVNAVVPGPVDSPMVQRIREGEPEHYRAIAELVPMRRWARPDEVAAVIGFLASPEASYVTGALVPVDGGASAMSGNWRP